MNFKIKIIFDWDEGEYLVFVDGINDLIGHGKTETKAIIDFFQNFEQFKNGEYFDSQFIKTILTKYEMIDNEI